jgi:hypothetical protein
MGTFVGVLALDRYSLGRLFTAFVVSDLAAQKAFTFSSNAAERCTEA